MCDLHLQHCLAALSPSSHPPSIAANSKQPPPSPNLPGCLTLCCVPERSEIMRCGSCGSWPITCKPQVALPGFLSLIHFPGQCPQPGLWVPGPQKHSDISWGHLVFHVKLAGLCPSSLSIFPGSNPSNPGNPLEALLRKSAATASLVHHFNPPRQPTSAPRNESWLGHIRVTLLSSAVTCWSQCYLTSPCLITPIVSLVPQ